MRRVNLKGMRTATIGMGGNLASCAGPPEATLVAAALWSANRALKFPIPAWPSAPSR